jgi:hypothetical protein
MPEHTDQAERPLEQLSMAGLAARFFRVSREYAFLQRQHAMIHSFTPEGRAQRLVRVREWQQKRKHRG